MIVVMSEEVKERFSVIKAPKGMSLQIEFL